MGTLSYVARRLVLAGITLWGITLVTFSLIALVPGDPAALPGGEPIDPERARQIREYFDLDKPVLVRYVHWVRRIVTGDLGRSLADRRPVADKIAVAVGPTLLVNAAALLIALGLSIPIGILSAWRQGGAFDRTAGTCLYALYAVPSYVGAIVLVLFVGVKWDLLPFRGMVSDDHASMGPLGGAADVAKHVVLYVACLTYGSLAFYSRFVRGNLLEVTRQDFIRTAWAKGLPARVVVLKHAFRNTLIPLITLLGLVLPFVLGSSVILEVIFTWPGLGRLYFTSVMDRDFPVVMALSTATAVLVLACTLVVDLLYVVVDPRISHG